MNIEGEISSRYKPLIRADDGVAMEVNQYGPCSESQQPPNRTSRDINHDPLASNRPQDDQQYVQMSQAMDMQNTDKIPAQNITQNLDNECQLQRMQIMSNQQNMTTGQAANAMSWPAGKQVDFGLLLSDGDYHTSASTNMNMSSLSLQTRQDPIPLIRMHGGRPTRFTTNSPNSNLWQSSAHKYQSLMSSIAYGKPDHMDQMNEQHKSQMSAPEGPSSFSRGQHTQTSGVPGSSKDNTFEMLSSRSGFCTPMNKPGPKSITAQLERQNVTHPKKPTAAQKNRLEASLVSSLSKKQKVTGAFMDLGIEQLDDVTTLSGVNLQEEEEQLFSGAKKVTRVSEASRKVVQEEEKKLFLQNIPLQKKVADIMAKCDIKNKSNDVDMCLSLCVEARMHGLITNFIRVSKQRVNIEKQRHRTVITSDVWQQIMSLNKKAREEPEDEQADTDKFQRTDEVNKEKDHKMRIKAANVAARASLGGVDMLSKWELMAEQARQKREGKPDAASASQPNVDIGLSPKPASTFERSRCVTGPIKKIQRNQDLAQSCDRVITLPHSISVQDVISVLEREIQMSRSTLAYHLYERASKSL